MEGTEIKFLGVAAFEITTSKGLKILVDPFLEHRYCAVKVKDLDRVDMILVTHAAMDHLGQTDAIAQKFNAPVICGNEVMWYLQDRGVPREQIKSLIIGMTTKIHGITIRAFESKHHSMIRMEDGRIITGTPLSFIACVDPGVRIYISGDTALFSDLKLIGSINKPNIGLINATRLRPLAREIFNRADLISGYMTPYEAALAAQWLGLEYVIPTHFDDFKLAEPDIQRFVKFLETPRDAPLVNPIVLKPGESFRYWTGKRPRVRSLHQIAGN